MDSLNPVQVRAVRVIHQDKSLENLNWLPISYIYKRRLLLRKHAVQKSTLTRAVIFSRFSTISQINVVSQSTIGQYLPKQIVTVDTERPVFMPNS